MSNSTDYIVWDADPEIIDLGIIALRWYSLCFVAAFASSYQILKSRFKRDNVPLHFLDKLTIYIILGTVVGARLGHCLFYDFEYYRRHILEIFLPLSFHPTLTFVGYQGLASHGGALGILIAVIVFSVRQGVSVFWILDRIAIVVPLAGCFICLGNFFKSEKVWIPTKMPWGIVFKKVDAVPRHPGQLYEAALYLLIFLTLQSFDKRVIDRQHGFIFGLFLILLFSARFITEFWKENQVPFEDSLPLNMGQLLSLPFIALGIILVITKSRIVSEHQPFMSKS